MIPAEIEALFLQVENAIDCHPRLSRVIGSGPIHGQPTLKVNRHGYRIEIPVKLIGSRKKSSVIHETGATAEEATNNLIKSLDYWAGAIE